MGIPGLADGFASNRLKPEVQCPQPSTKFELHKNVIYATHDGVELAGRSLRAGRTGAPSRHRQCHGGYWRRGSRDTFNYWGPYLAERGYAGFTISYRLTKPGQKTYPAAGP